MKLRSRNFNIVLLVVLPVFGLIASGCSCVDKDVAKTSSSFWIPPSRESSAKKSQLNKVVDANAILATSELKLDLPMLVDIAFENSPATKKSWQAARIAAAQSGKAASVFFPQVKIYGMVDRSELNTPGSKSFATSWYPSIEMQYSIFQFGGHVKSADAAKQLLYAANYQHNRELQTLACAVQRCYFLLDSAISTVEASEKNLDDAFVAYDAAFVKNQSGLSNIQDYLQAKANKSRAEFELENARSQVEMQRAALAQVIGITVSEDLQIVRTPDQSDINDFDVNIQDLISATVEIRQDILASHSVVKSRKDAAWTSTTKMLPELIIGGNGSRKFFHRRDGHFDSFDIYAGLQWTVFDGFNNIYDVVEARAKEKQAEQDLRQLKLSVASDVWAKYHAFKSAIKQLNAARNYEQSSQESFDSMVISYKNGLSTFNELMTSQTQLATARKQTVDSKNNLSLAVVDLAYTVGVVNFDYKK